MEHVLPRRPEANWPQFTPDEVEMYANRLGNQALLRASDNSVLKSDPFEKKRPVFAASPYVLTGQIGSLLIWDAEAIVARQKNLAALAVKAWPV